MNKNMETVMKLMQHNGLMQAFVINAINNEANRVIEFYEENPERLNKKNTIVNPQAWLQCARDAQNIL